MRNKIEVLKQETRYIIRDGKGHSISVIVSGDEKHISIYRYTYFNEPFEFVGSRKERVEAVIRLLSEAMKLVKK